MGAEGAEAQRQQSALPRVRPSSGANLESSRQTRIQVSAHRDSPSVTPWALPTCDAATGTYSQQVKVVVVCYQDAKPF